MRRMANGEGCGACGFGLVSRAPGGLGSHRPPQLRGAVRKGLVERMKAGRKPLRDQGDLANGSFHFQKALPKTKEKRRGEAPKGAPARVMGRPSPPLKGRALP